MTAYPQLQSLISKKNFAEFEASLKVTLSPYPRYTVTKFFHALPSTCHSKAEQQESWTAAVSLNRTGGGNKIKACGEANEATREMADLEEKEDPCP